MKDINTESSESPRAEVIVIVCTLQERTAFHFCSVPLLQGLNCDLWWPMPEGESLHSAIESVMVINHIAHNVTSLNPIRRQGKSTDYRVVFNKTQAKK